MDYKIKRMLEERKNRNRHTTSSIRKIIGLLRKGWSLFQPVQAAGGRYCISSMHWNISGPGATEYFNIPASAIDKLIDLNIIKTHGRKAEFLLDKDILTCTNGCRINIKHPMLKNYKPGDQCPNELSHDIMAGGTTYCRRILY